MTSWLDDILYFNIIIYKLYDVCVKLSYFCVI